MAGPGNQATLLNTITLPEFTDLVRRNWVMEQKDIYRNAQQLFITQDIGSGNGSTKMWNEVDAETYADVKSEGANAQKSKVGVGYNVTMTARTMAKQVDITLEMRNDNRYAEVGSYLTNLSRFCVNRQDLDLTHRFTFANAATYTDKNGFLIDISVGDGLALLSATHTLAFSPITYSNLVTGGPAFSQGAFEAAKLLAATQIYSNFGEKRQKNFNTIISGDDPGTVRTIKQLLESTADIDAVQAGIVNVYEGAMRHVVLPNLATTAAGAYDSTKRRWWFIGATGQGINGWQAFFGTWIAPTLRTPAPGNNGEDINSLNWTYTGFCRYGIAVVSPKGMIGSTPTS
jgi:hypothetical protein